MTTLPSTDSSPIDSTVDRTATNELLRDLSRQGQELLGQLQTGDDEGAVQSSVRWLEVAQDALTARVAARGTATIIDALGDEGIEVLYSMSTIIRESGGTIAGAMGGYMDLYFFLRSMHLDIEKEKLDARVRSLRSGKDSVVENQRSTAAKILATLQVLEAHAATAPVALSLGMERAEKFFAKQGIDSSNMQKK